MLTEKCLPDLTQAVVVVQIVVDLRRHANPNRAFENRYSGDNAVLIQEIGNAFRFRR